MSRDGCEDLSIHKLPHLLSQMFGILKNTKTYWGTVNTRRFGRSTLPFVYDEESLSPIFPATVVLIKLTFEPVSRSALGFD